MKMIFLILLQLFVSPPSIPAYSNGQLLDLDMVIMRLNAEGPFNFSFYVSGIAVYDRGIMPGDFE